MLSWAGTNPRGRVTAFAVQHLEGFSAQDAAKSQPPTSASTSNVGWARWTQDLPQGGHDDNKEALTHLLANGFSGQVKLICIDPPFDSGADCVRKVQQRSPKGTLKIDGEDCALDWQVIDMLGEEPAVVPHA